MTIGKKHLRFIGFCLSLISAAVLTMGTAACSLNATPTQTPKLSSIALLPANPSQIAAGSTMQFFAHGTYSDGAVADITGQVAWNSDSDNIATIDINGLATGVAAGQANITASLAGITSPAAILPVIPAPATTTTNPGPALVSIAITQPSTPSINLILAGTPTQQFVATGTYSDGSTAVITTLVTWVSSATGVASISSAGLAKGLAAGTTLITATMPGVVSNKVIIYVTAN
jgi:trimeric autotransporter adhesin